MNRIAAIVVEFSTAIYRWIYRPQDPVTVGGWLFALAFCLGVIIPVNCAYVIYAVGLSADPMHWTLAISYSTFCALIILLNAFYGILALASGVSILRRANNAINFLRQVLMILMLLNLLFVAITFVFLTSEVEMTRLSVCLAMLFESAAAFLPPVIVLIYLRKSKRVRMTFPDDAYVQRLRPCGKT